MRLLLKILVVPIVAVLAIFIWLCSGVLCLSAWMFGLAGTILSILAVLLFLTGSVAGGIAFALLAILVSPVGIPMLGVWLLGKLKSLRYAIQDRVYG
ncbi:MAG: CD1845 family protein [Oscillospiraceae bacterium]|nr:CD1845 family protein [Oscillospiraceae bacterium]